MIPGIKNIINYYIGKGFRVRNAIMDRDFEPLRSEFLGERVTFITGGRGDHVPEAERNDHIIKERTSAVLSSTPHVKYPSLMIVEAVSFSVMWLNALPNKHGISRTASPRALVDGTTLKYNSQPL